LNFSFFLPKRAKLNVRRKLPESLVAFEAVSVVERQVRWRQIRGSFQLSISVSTKDELEQPEEQLYSMLLAVSDAVTALQRADERATLYLQADNLWNSNYKRYVGFLAPGMSIRLGSAPGFLTGRL
jgi:hypothetical protein